MHWGMRHLGAVWGATRGYAGKGTADRPILVVNPGQPLGIVKPPDGVLVVTYEGVQPTDRAPQPWEAAIVYSCPTPDAQRSRLATNGWSWSFVTSDGSDGNPFDGVEG